MTTDDCWLCTTPPGAQTHITMRTLCTCEFELQYHSYGHPHGLSTVGCSAFLAELPLPTPKPETDAQVALF